jgi:hypothetical protein
MFGSIKDIWRSETERIVDFGIFETKKDPVIVQASLVNELPSFQLAQGKLFYRRSLPWGEWHGVGFWFDDRKVQGRGLNSAAIRERAVEKFIRYY